MHKIDGAGHVNGTWVNEDVALLRPPTEITADIMNALQSEIINVIEGAGFALNKPTNTQLLSAIQALIKGGDYKDSVRFTTTANIVLTGLGTQAGGDWPAALTAGERIFPKNQTAGAENGIYIAAAGAWTRATDADTGAEFNSGAIIPVESSATTLADSNWQLTTDGTVVIGTTALIFVQAGVIVASVLPGAVAYYAMPTAPTGWLKANGALVSRTLYAPLFSAIGTSFGVGDGTSTFGLPDLRGEFLRGFDDARGIDAGRAIGTFQKGTVNNFDAGAAAAVLGARSASTAVGGVAHEHLGLDYDNAVTNYPSALHAFVTAGGAAAITNTAELGFGIVRPRNIALLACIKF